MSSKFNFEDHFKNTTRSVTKIDKNGKIAYSVNIERIFETSIDDLWEALTNKERLSRWFLPVNGELKQGNRYKLEGNAEGEITSCDPPNSFSLTWEFGGDISWVEVYLSVENSEKVKLKLCHIAYPSPFWDTYGPGAVGVGWELGVLGLMYHLKFPTRSKIDGAEWSASTDGKEFITQSSNSWGQAAIEAGTDEIEANQAVKQTTAFYTGVPNDT
jgi:uncharacterized protein YndB with AHSA1/START domain